MVSDHRVRNPIATEELFLPGFAYLSDSFGSSLDKLLPKLKHRRSLLILSLPYWRRMEAPEHLPSGRVSMAVRAPIPSLYIAVPLLWNGTREHQGV